MRGNQWWIGVGMALACAAAGCSSAHEAGAGDGGWPLPDVGPAYFADAAVVRCGAATCPANYVCCNASCGICALPTEGCIALDCTDAGPPVRPCGGFISATCTPSEYCDFPDDASCGGDDSTGTCRPRPTDCPDPGGILVCGCDGTEYIGECSANFSGTDVAHVGGCDTPPPPRGNASAQATCAPWDGAAWRFVVTDGLPVCTGTRRVSGITIDVWEGLEAASPGTTYEIGTDFSSRGQATHCAGPSVPCTSLTGRITIESFTASGAAVFSYSLQGDTDAFYVGNHVRVSAWCASERFCG